MAQILERQSPNKLTSTISTLTVLIFLPLLLLGVYQTISVLTQAFGTPANISVNTSIQLQPISLEYIRAFAQGGEEPTDMLKPVLPEIQALKPRYIRIDHIYDYFQVVGKSGNELTFDFSRLDNAVDTIKSTGAIPVLALSYMPAAIAKDGSIINPPNNWEDWSLVVQKTIEHYSGKTNKNFQNMFYEVWNEPDLAQFGGWKLTGEKNYITLYRFAAQGAQKAQNVHSFSLGGPATTGLYKNWIMALINAGVRLDYFTWHSYLPDPKQFAVDQENIASWLIAYPEYTALPKFITEFGFTGAKDPRYNTMYAAAYTAAVVRNTVVGGPQALFSFQLKDGPQQENGWGLLQHEQAGKGKKPRYDMYNFLESMQGTRLELKGEGSWISSFATIKDGTIRVLLVNFNHQSEKSENVPVSLDKLAPGAYTYRERFFQGRDVTFKETVTDSSLKKNVYMPANSVAIIELAKQQ